MLPFRLLQSEAGDSVVRRTKHASFETRETILNAAQACYLDLGVSASSLAEVAQRAGCTRGAIYWHFPGAFELLRAVIERGRYPLVLIST